MVIPAISSPTTITVVSGPFSQKQKHTSSICTTTHTDSSFHLKSLLKSGKLDEAMRLIESPPSKGGVIEPDLDTYCLFFHACITRKSLKHGQKLHLRLLSSRKTHFLNLLNNPSLKSKLITLYSVCGRIDVARLIFEDDFEVAHDSKSVWVAMLIACSRNCLFEEVLFLYAKMQYRFIRPDNFAFSAVLKACSELSELRIGRVVHTQVLKSEEFLDQMVNNALLQFYAKCGSFDELIQMFEEMPQRNIVSWNSLLTGFSGRDYLFESLDTFRRMQGEGLHFSWVTLTTILPVCARLTALRSGKEIHSQLVKSRLRPDIPMLNSLMDMYAKCGAMKSCRKVFDMMLNKDLMSWNIMLMGYAINGYATMALKLFKEMVETGFRPDGVTFIALLSGCSHAGLIAEGQSLFDRMEMEFGVSPSVKHYACLVDLLGRAGQLKEALGVVKNMPMSPSGSIWGSLLNSCRLYGNIELGEAVAKQLFEIEPDNPGNYVMLSNIYGSVGRWEAVKEVREMMEKKGIKKEAGCSWVQIQNKIYSFVSGGDAEFRGSIEYKRVWNDLMEAMKEVGYVPDTGVVLHDVDEEMKVTWVCGHSERLAAVFSLVQTGPATPIRITKNLRVCVDCHNWMKIISRVTSRIIVLRDTNRFHHFEDGECSCKDYW